MTSGVCLGSPADGLKAGEENWKQGRGACLGKSRQTTCLRDVRDQVCSHVGEAFMVPAEEAQRHPGCVEEASVVGGAQSGVGLWV